MPSQQWVMGVMSELNRLWIFLPLQGAPKGIDDGSARERQEQVLKAYGAALDGYSIEAINSVVTALGRGEVEGQNTRWCPTPPELSSFVRAEQKRLDALNRRPAVSYQPVSQAWKDWRVIHRMQTEELQAKGFTLVKADVALETLVSGSKRRIWPVGALWFWSLGEVWAPIGAAYPSTGIIAQEMAA